MRRRSAAAAVRLVVALTVTLIVAGGCTELPESGPVEKADVAGAGDDRGPSDFNVAPPAPGASPLDIVKGFLDAMQAWPVRVDIARQFLTDAAASEWDPAAATITYTDKLPAQGEGSQVTVSLTDADLIDRSGAWRGRLPAGQQQLGFHLDLDHGEYRIADPRDALIVPAPWFAPRYSQVSLYFFDRTGTTLVPEPVFVPRGQQLATTLVSGLVAGPGDELHRIVRTYLPRGLSVGLSVPVSSTGVADVELLGNGGGLTVAAVDRIFAQLAWTLGQDPTITALRISVGGAELRAPGGGREFPVDQASEFDPTGADASPRLYGLENGRLAVADGAELKPLSGPFSTRRYGLTSVAVDLPATRAAGVTRDQRVLVADVAPPANHHGRPDVVLDGGEHLLRPAWDASGRLWMVDRRRGDAVVRYLENGRLRTLSVPGVSGHDVKAFLVSRDATRFAAVVRGASADQVRVGRIEFDDRGGVAAATPTILVTADPASQQRIRDIAWTSPTTIALVSPVQPHGVFEVRSVGVDGGPITNDALSTTFSGPVVGLAGTPVSPLTQYAVTSSGLVDLVTGVSLRFAGAVRGVEYVG